MPNQCILIPKWKKIDFGWSFWRKFCEKNISLGVFITPSTEDGLNAIKIVTSTASECVFSKVVVLFFDGKFFQMTYAYNKAFDGCIVQCGAVFDLREPSGKNFVTMFFVTLFRLISWTIDRTPF